MSLICLKIFFFLSFNNNYLFNKKNGFFLLFFSFSAKISHLFTIADGGVGAQVIKRMFLAPEQRIQSKTVVLYFIGHQVFFYISASAAKEHG
jgi:hypothetical protein